MEMIGSMRVFFLKEQRCQVWLNYFVGGFNFITKASVSLNKPEGNRHSYFRISVSRLDVGLVYRAKCDVSSTRDDLPPHFMFVFDMGMEPDDDKPIKVMVVENMGEDDYCIAVHEADFNDLFGLIAEQELNETLGEQNEIYIN